MSGDAHEWSRRSARGLLPFRHLRWACGDRAEVRTGAAEYLADGDGVDPEDHATPRSPDPELVVDASRVDLVDHRGLLVLDAWAAKRGTRVTMVTPHPVVARIAALVGPANLDVQVRP